MSYTLEDLSLSAHTVASWRASNRKFGTWDGCYFWALKQMGFDLVPVPAGTKLGKDGPIWAPVPDGVPESWLYPYPSVIAPVGWTPTPATQPGSSPQQPETPAPAPSEPK